MEEKDFDQWNEKKKTINFYTNFPLFQVGQLWWAYLGKNIATEIDGKGENYSRPVIIIQKVYTDACLVIPLTSSCRTGDYYVSFEDNNGREQCACLAQTRYIDAKG